MRLCVCVCVFSSNSHNFSSRLPLQTVTDCVVISAFFISMDSIYVECLIRNSVGGIEITSCVCVCVRDKDHLCVYASLSVVNQNRLPLTDTNKQSSKRFE